MGTEGELTLSSISEPGKQCVFAAALNLKERVDSHVLEWWDSWTQTKGYTVGETKPLF